MRRISLPREGFSVIEYRISSFCTFGDCVEVGQLPGGAVAVRDTKDRAQAPLTFTGDEWVAFVAGVKAGEFDLPEDLGSIKLSSWMPGGSEFVGSIRCPLALRIT